ncbi:MAG: type II toxin-antitoxin system RelE/ParE family toxin [Pseudonocardiaceae bacterium]
MTYTVQWARKTLKQLEKLDRTAQKKIVLAVTKLVGNPRPHGVKSLVTRPGEYRLRVGDYSVRSTMTSGLRRSGMSLDAPLMRSSSR